MSNRALLNKQVLAQTSAIGQPSEIGNFFATENLWLSSTFGLALVLVGLVSYGKIKLNKITKEIKLEKLKNEDLRKKLNLALNTLEQIETNQDLADSREFNLDYLRMRMEEEVFHQSIANQIKVEVSKLINIAFRPNLNSSVQSVANKTECQLDRTFDIFYKTDDRGETEKRVLFRIQLKLMKSPSQSPARTIQEIIQCLEGFLNPETRSKNWQPTIAGRLVKIDWDQKAKPTPLLVFQQSTQGMNVSLHKEVQKFSRGGGTPIGVNLTV